MLVCSIGCVVPAGSDGKRQGRGHGHSIPHVLELQSMSDIVFTLDTAELRSSA
jgi:hypothetical protein